MRRADITARLAAAGALALIGAAAAALITVTSLVLFVHPIVRGGPDLSSADVGGVRYDVANSWPIDPLLGANKPLVQGMPAAYLHLPHDQMLLGAFLDVTNVTDSPAQTADKIVLRDVGGVTYPVVPLPDDNPFAYNAPLLDGRASVPGFDSPAGSDIAAGGLLLLFVLPRKAYAEGPLQLVIKDPVSDAVAQPVV